jgi:N utilization substance protein A
MNETENIMERSIGFKERRYIEELRILTRATAFDCIIDDRFDRVIYVIKPGDMGLAIGKNGDNIKKMLRVLGRRVEMVEFDENREAFIANMFKPAAISSIRFGVPDEIIEVAVDQQEELALAIGRGGSTIEKARMLVSRFYGKDIGELVVAEGDASDV